MMNLIQPAVNSFELEEGTAGSRVDVSKIILTYERTLALEIV